MADTPAETPKRRRTTKAAADGASASKAARAKAPAKPRATASSRAKAPAKEGETAPRARTKKASAAPAPAKTAAKRTTTKADAPQKAAPAPAPTPTPKPSPKPTPRRAAAREPFPEPPRIGWLAALGAAAAGGGAWFVWRASRAEEPDYQTVESDGAIEIRKYPSLVTAATVTRGERDKALNDGFRTLADYIFAKSRPGARLPMTAPVLSDAPADAGGWRTRFIMPRGKARAELPPAPDGVELATEPAARIAAIRFSGRADTETLESKEAELRSWLQSKGLPHEGKAVHAFYNAPFLPGPLRRNEVMVRLSDEGGTG